VRLLRQYFCAKKLQSQNIAKEKMPQILLYQKFVRKMLIKLTPVCNLFKAQIRKVPIFTPSE
jgi:hypothetical protein